MLKLISYDGTYRDENITVSVVLENPLDYGLATTALAFSVVVKDKNGNNTSPHIDDFVFYLMDENFRLHNMQFIQHANSRPIASLPLASEDDEPIRIPNGIIHTVLQPEFIFYDLRVAFYYRRSDRIEIIRLQRH
jgi:hypothetical protein